MSIPKSHLNLNLNEPQVSAIAKSGHLDMLVADWDMVPVYWENFLREQPNHPAANRTRSSIPCTLYRNQSTTLEWTFSSEFLSDIAES